MFYRLRAGGGVHVQKRPTLGRHSHVKCDSTTDPTGQPRPKLGAEVDTRGCNGSGAHKGLQWLRAQAYPSSTALQWHRAVKAWLQG